MKPLRLQALYTVNALAEAAGVGRRRFHRLLRSVDVRFLRLGRLTFVTMTELETKVPELWESIQATETLRRALDDST
jgi:hypothetical protein